MFLRWQGFYPILPVYIGQWPVRITNRLNMGENWYCTRWNRLIKVASKSGLKPGTFCKTRARRHHWAKSMKTYRTQSFILFIKVSHLDQWTLHFLFSQLECALIDSLHSIIYCCPAKYFYINYKDTCYHWLTYKNVKVLSAV